MSLATLDTRPTCEATVIATTSTTASEISDETAMFERGTGDTIITTVSRHTETRVIETLAIEILVICETHETHETFEIHTIAKEREISEILAIGISGTLEMFAMLEIVIRVTFVVPAN